MTKSQKEAHIQMLQMQVKALGFEQDRYSNWVQHLETVKNEAIAMGIWR